MGGGEAAATVEQRASQTTRTGGFSEADDEEEGEEEEERTRHANRIPCNNNSNNGNHHTLHVGHHPVDVSVHARVDEEGAVLGGERADGRDDAAHAAVETCSCGATIHTNPRSPPLPAPLLHKATLPSLAHPALSRRPPNAATTITTTTTTRSLSGSANGQFSRPFMMHFTSVMKSLARMATMMGQHENISDTLDLFYTRVYSTIESILASTTSLSAPSAAVPGVGRPTAAASPTRTRSRRWRAGRVGFVSAPHTLYPHQPRADTSVGRPTTSSPRYPSSTPPDGRTGLVNHGAAEIKDEDNNEEEKEKLKRSGLMCHEGRSITMAATPVPTRHASATFDMDDVSRIPPPSAFGLGALLLRRRRGGRLVAGLPSAGRVTGAVALVVDDPALVRGAYGGGYMQRTVQIVQIW